MVKSLVPSLDANNYVYIKAIFNLFSLASHKISHAKMQSQQNPQKTKEKNVITNTLTQPLKMSCKTINIG